MLEHELFQSWDQPKGILDSPGVLKIGIQGWTPKDPRTWPWSWTDGSSPSRWVWIKFKKRLKEPEECFHLGMIPFIEAAVRFLCSRERSTGDKNLGNHQGLVVSSTSIILDGSQEGSVSGAYPTISQSTLGLGEKPTTCIELHWYLGGMKPLASFFWPTSNWTVGLSGPSGLSLSDCQGFCLLKTMLTCIHAYMHTCIHAYMHTCMHACMYVCICVYIYIYKHDYTCMHHLRISVRL